MSNEADEAEQSLRELDALTVRTRRASRSMATGRPLVAWGVAWIIGLAALDLLDGPPRFVVAALAWAAAILVSWLPMRSAIRTGVETRMRWAWVVVLASSPFIVGAARPETSTHALLLIGALWGLAMTLYAVATGDRTFAAAAGAGVVVAGAVSMLDVDDALLWYGVLGGLPLLVLGISRVFREARRV